MDLSPYDASNPLLDPDQAAALTTNVATAKTGEKRGLATIRTATTTLTVGLDAEACELWGDRFKAMAAEMRGGLIIPTAIIPPNHRYPKGQG